MSSFTPINSAVFVSITAASSRVISSFGANSVSERPFIIPEFARKATSASSVSANELLTLLSLISDFCSSILYAKWQKSIRDILAVKSLSAKKFGNNPASSALIKLSSAHCEWLSLTSAEAPIPVVKIIDTHNAPKTNFFFIIKSPLNFLYR